MSKKFNSDLLRIARQARGWSQAELARQSAVPQANLSKLENDLISLTDDVLDSVAKALRFPNSFFYQQDRIVGLPMSVQYRKSASVGQRSIGRLEAELNIRILHLRRLLASAAPEAELPLPQMDEYNGNPEEIADLLRKTWLVPSGPIQNLVGWVERSGCIVEHCDFAELKVDGVTIHLSDMPPCIFLNRNQPADRQRFSLAHELGHIVMHRVPSPEMEDEANAFAAALLMPERDIRPNLSGNSLTLPHLAALKPVWKVSMAALLVRAKTIGTITANQSQYLWRQMSSRGYRRTEPVELEFEAEVPSVLPDIIRLHIEDLGYDIEDLSAALHVSDDYLRTLYALPGQHLRIVK